MLSGGLEGKMYDGYVDSENENQNYRCWQDMLTSLQEY